MYYFSQFWGLAELFLCRFCLGSPMRLTLAGKSQTASLVGLGWVLASGESLFSSPGLSLTSGLAQASLQYGQLSVPRGQDGKLQSLPEPRSGTPTAFQGQIPRNGEIALLLAERSKSHCIGAGHSLS